MSLETSPPASIEVSDRCKKAIKKSEGLVLRPYRCPAGKWTIGYGHLITKPEMSLFFLGKVPLEIPLETAEALFEEDIVKCEEAIERNVTVELSQGQYDALVSFIFNLGEANFARSTLCKKLNLGLFESASKEILRWNKIRDPKTKKYRVSKGLDRRRKLEASWFNET